MRVTAVHSESPTPELTTTNEVRPFRESYASASLIDWAVRSFPQYTHVVSHREESMDTGILVVEASTSRRDYKNQILCEEPQLLACRPTVFFMPPSAPQCTNSNI